MISTSQPTDNVGVPVDDVAQQLHIARTHLHMLVAAGAVPTIDGAGTHIRPADRDALASQLAERRAQLQQRFDNSDTNRDALIDELAAHQP